MTLAKRIIPCLDVDAGRVVKGVRFENLRDAGDPVELAARYDAEGADELVFLDITATVEGRRATFDVISRTAEQVFIPLTVGGGVRNEDDVRALLRAGADKVSLNTAAVRDPALLSRCADRFGTQCMVVAIDAKRRNGDGWRVVVEAGRAPTERDAVEWAVEATDSGGAGEVLLTDGPYIEGAEVANGFYFIDVSDRDEAVKVASMIPATTVQLRQLMGISGP